MNETLHLLETTDFPRIKRSHLETLQVNLGYLCNQQCLHCHVDASPRRTEIMTRESIDTVVAFIEKQNIKTLDLTGGAPEMNPHFRELVESAKSMGVHVMDRCNLTILEQPGYEDTAAFLAEHKVEVVASLPCYQKENVEKQRGKGVFDESIKGLKQLNDVGYGTHDDLIINLVFNPQGPNLPPEQTGLEAAYKKELREHFDIVFNHLFTITNMPIKRFGSTLISKGQFRKYMDLLKSSHQDGNLDGVMCKNLISVDWQGYVYDCDFNQMLGLHSRLSNGKTHLLDLMELNFDQQSIVVKDHCYGCTAGQGSSCGGALEI